jgi:hypothetical protein
VANGDESEVTKTQDALAGIKDVLQAKTDDLQPSSYKRKVRLSRSLANVVRVPHRAGICGRAPRCRNYMTQLRSCGYHQLVLLVLVFASHVSLGQEG